MKVIVWQCLIGNSSVDQTLFSDGKVLSGLGVRQCENELQELTLGTIEAKTGFCFGADCGDEWFDKLPPTTKCWMYNDNVDGDGLTFVVIDSKDLV